MAVSIVGSILLGAFLGRFFKVFVLAPVIAIILAGEFGKAIAFHLGVWRPLCEFALMTASLQIGYVAIPILCAVLDPLRHIKLQRKETRSEASASIAATRHR